MSTCVVCLSMGKKKLCSLKTRQSCRLLTKFYVTIVVRDMISMNLISLCKR